MEQDEDSEDHHSGMQTSELPSSRFYEELFCTNQTSGPLVPLASALITSAGPQSDVVKQGYLGKLERNHRRYFVLRAGSHTGPSRLEWYKSQEKFTAMEKSSGKAVLFGSSKQGVIYLRCCLGVSRTGSSRKGHTVAVYAKDQTMVLVVEDQHEQEDWYLAIKKLMEEEQKDEEHGERLDEEDDDGYCTLPLAAFFKEQSSMPETGSYMEMKMEHCRGASCRMEGLELGEEEEEEKALGYMMMSPQVSDSSPALPMDDYVTMTSPCKHQWPPFSSPSPSPSPSSSLQTSFSSSTSDSYSPVHPSHHQTNEHSSIRPLDDAELEQKSVQDRRHLAQRVATSSPVGSVNVSDLMPPFFTSGAGYTKPVQWF